VAVAACNRQWQLAIAAATALLSPIHTAGDYSHRKRRLSPNSATNSGDYNRNRSVDRAFHTGDYSRRIRRQSARLLPFSATVAEFGDKLSPFPVTIVAGVDRALSCIRTISELYYCLLCDVSSSEHIHVNRGRLRLKYLMQMQNNEHVHYDRQPEPLVDLLDTMNCSAIAIPLSIRLYS